MSSSWRQADMADLALLSAQVAAADGDPAALAQWLRDDKPLKSKDKAFIADLLEGKVKQPPPKKKGRPRRRVYHYTWLELVATRYRQIAVWLRRRGRLYGNRELLIDALARKYEVDATALSDQINRGKRRQKSAQK
jgi:hypothetical protein